MRENQKSTFASPDRFTMKFAKSSEKLRRIADLGDNFM